MRSSIAFGVVAFCAISAFALLGCKADGGSGTATAPAPTASGTSSASASGSGSTAASGSTPKTGGTTGATPVAGTLAINALADAYPEGFAISALPAKVPTELPTTIQSVGTVALQAGLDLLNTDPPVNDKPYDPSAQTVSEKLADATAKLTGEVAACFSAGMLNTRTFDIHSFRCYDPDGDLDVSVGGSTPGAKLDGTEEACMAGYGRATLASTVGIVDGATGLVLAMLCQAKKDGKASALPAVAATLDLKATLQIALHGGATVNTAAISRLADQTGGRPVYRTDVTITTV